MADNLHLACVHSEDYSDIPRPQPVVILTIVAAGKCASGLLLVPTNGGRRRRGFISRFVLLVVWNWLSGGQE